MRRSDRIKRKRPIVPIKKSAKVRKVETVTPSKVKEGGFYDTQYKKLLIIPFIILALAITSIAFQAVTTGDFIHRGVSLKGGVLVTVPTSIDVNEILNEFRADFPNNDIEGRTLEESGEQVAVTLTADLTSAKQVESFIKKLEAKTSVAKKEYSIETIGSSLGETFFEQTVRALFMAFLFMGFVVFIYFGKKTLVKVITGVATLVAASFIFNANSVLLILALIIGIGLIITYSKFSIPSVAVILAAFSDIIVTLAIVNLMGMKLGTAGIAAFLMLIGYSVDTDILLSTRVLKRKGGSVYQRVISAFKTGMTMNLTTMTALTIALIFSQSEIISQIMTILLIGLAVDMINTWLQNVGILRWHLENKGDNK